MLYDFIIINKKDKTPLYRQIYMNSCVQRDIYQTGHEADIMLRHSSAVHRQKAIKCLQISTKQKDTMNMISAVKALMTV